MFIDPLRGESLQLELFDIRVYVRRRNDEAKQSALEKLKEKVP